MRRIVIAAVLGALALAVAAVSGGLAASGANQSQSGPPPTLKQFRADRLKERDARLDRVAKRVGKTGDDLRAAMDTVRKRELDKLVRAGRLTQAERDALEACRTAPLTCDRSNLPAPRLERFRGRPPRRGARLDKLVDAVAHELGVQPADLRRAFRAERPPWREGRPPMGGHVGPGGAVAPAPAPGDAGPGGMIGA
jgi:hypothetical protein